MLMSIYKLQLINVKVQCKLGANLFEVWLCGNNLLQSELDLGEVCRQCKQRRVQLFLFCLETCQALHVVCQTQSSGHHTVTWSWVFAKV